MIQYISANLIGELITTTVMICAMLVALMIKRRTAMRNTEIVGKSVHTRRCARCGDAMIAEWFDEKAKKSA